MRWFLKGDEIIVTTSLFFFWELVTTSCLMITTGSILIIMVPITTIWQSILRLDSAFPSYTNIDITSKWFKTCGLPISSGLNGTSSSHKNGWRVRPWDKTWKPTYWPFFLTQRIYHVLLLQLLWQCKMSISIFLIRL